MYYSRYRNLLGLNKILQKNQEYYYDFKLRCYCQRVLVSSEALNNDLQTDDEPIIQTDIQKYKNPEPIPNCGSTVLKIKADVKKKIKFNSNQVYLKNSSVYKSSDYIDGEITQMLSPKDNEIIYSNPSEQSNTVLEDEVVELDRCKRKYNLSEDEFSYDKYINDFNKIVPKPLDDCKEDLSSFGPGLSPTFNFAAYADKSELIQTFVKLGVELYKLEKNQDYMRALLTVDLKTELPIYLQFFRDCGVPSDKLGNIITFDPMILKEDLDDMKTRIRYLRAHAFTQDSIARIVTNNPTWLVWATKHIDERLGHFQNEFKLSGSEVRFLATKQPKIITYNMKHICETTFAVKEEMGFNRDETRILLLSKPRIWMNSRKKIVESFNYLHNSMSLTHHTIVLNANLLTCRSSRLKNRHEFLLELNKVQYDPTKLGYISPLKIAMGSDAEFCTNVAKTSVETYNLFLRTR